MKTYWYYISYICEIKASGKIGNGAGEVSLKNQITTYDHIKFVVDKIERQEDVKNVTIFNFILLREETE